MVDLVIQLTAEEHAQLETRARERGFTNIDDYLKSLIELDAEQDDLSHAELRASIKQGFREALRGEYVPLDSLWRDDDE